MPLDLHDAVGGALGLDLALRLDGGVEESLLDKQVAHKFVL